MVTWTNVRYHKMSTIVYTRREGGQSWIHVVVEWPPRRLPKLFAKLPQRLAALSWKWGHDKELEKNSPRFSTWCTHNTLTRSDLHKIFLPDYALLLLLLCHALRKMVKSYEVWDLIFFEIAFLVEVDGNSFDFEVPSFKIILILWVIFRLRPAAGSLWRL